ncbi:MAG: transposase [Halioglobus sp.]
MPRKPRMYLGGIPCHIIQRGNNRNACFFAEEDYLYYLSQLGDACLRYKVQLHAYVLMTNHNHLLMTPTDESGISRVMQSLGRRYVQYINKAYCRTGTLWEGRHKSNPIQADDYLLACYRYIELNPVRAAMTPHPADYLWSSYRANAYGERNRYLTTHPLYLGLGATPQSREERYRALFTTELDEKLVREIRTAASFSTPLGNARFVEQIEHATGNKAGQAKRGRPAKRRRKNE